MKKKLLVIIFAIISVFALVFGLTACDGNADKSAYETWLEAGHEGTEEDFLAWLKGEDENPQGLDFYPLGDGSSYGVAGGYAKYSDTIEIPSTYCGKPVTTILDNGFAYSKIKSIIIPESVAIIGNYAFANCSSLTSVTIPDSVTVIGNYAFVKCSNLASVTIPDNVTVIGNSAFSRCIRLTSITIPDSVTIIGSEAFYNCSSLKNVTIPDSVTIIGNDTFKGCTDLTNVTIGNGVSIIGNYAFNGCTGLINVTMGNGVSIIGNYAFDNCNNLTIVYYACNAEQWDKLSIGSSNTNLAIADKYYYSETEPAEEGNYWHFGADGVTPVIWTKQ